MSYSYPGPQPPQPQAPQRQGMSTGKKIALFGCLPATLLGLLIVGGCAVVGGAVVNEVDKSVKADAADDKRAASEDVDVTQCEIVNEQFGGRSVTAEVKVTNNGKKRADYFIEGEFLDQDGNKVDALYATIEDLEAGKSSTQDFSGAIFDEQLKGVTKGSCKLLDVSRDEWSAANN